MIAVVKSTLLESFCNGMVSQEFFCMFNTCMAQILMKGLTVNFPEFM